MLCPLFYAQLKMRLDEEGLRRKGLFCLGVLGASGMKQIVLSGQVTEFEIVAQQPTCLPNSPLSPGVFLSVREFRLHELGLLSL